MLYLWVPLVKWFIEKHSDTFCAQLDLKRLHKCVHTLTMYSVEEFRSHVTYYTSQLYF